MNKPNSQPERFSFDNNLAKKIVLISTVGTLAVSGILHVISDKDKICGATSVTVGQGEGISTAIEKQIPPEALDKPMDWYVYESKSIGDSSKTNTQWGDRFMVPLTNCSSKVTILPWNENGPEVLAPGADKPAVE